MVVVSIKRRCALSNGRSCYSGSSTDGIRVASVIRGSVLSTGPSSVARPNICKDIAGNYWRYRDSPLQGFRVRGRSRKLNIRVVQVDVCLCNCIVAWRMGVVGPGVRPRCHAIIFRSADISRCFGVNSAVGASHRVRLSNMACPCIAVSISSGSRPFCAKGLEAITSRKGITQFARHFNHFIDAGGKS